MSVFFNGRLLTTPTAASAVDDSNFYNGSASVGNNLAILGSAGGGAPNTVYTFDSLDQAQSVLLSGEALQAIKSAFDPSNETGGPSKIYFIRVDTATQSTLTLNDLHSNPSISLQSSDYGIHVGRVAITIQPGSIQGYQVTTSFDQVTNFIDNIYRGAFTIFYSGTATTATLAITNTSLTLTIGGNATVIDLNTYNTVQKLVNYLNSTAFTGITAAVVGGSGGYSTVNGLDGTTAAANIKTTQTPPVQYNVNAHLQAIVDAINGAAENFCTATRVGTQAPAPIGWTYFTGGTAVAPANSTNWQNAFNLLQTVDVQWVVPITPTSSFQANAWSMADAHCQYMSSVGKKERRAIVGGSLGLTTAQAITNAALINSDRTSYVCGGYYDFDVLTGALTLFSPYVLAGLIGGMAAGVSPGTPLTHKQVNIQGLEMNLRNPADTDTLILGGVLCLAKTNTGFSIVKSITTWLINTNFNRVEMSTGAATDYAARTVREALAPLLGNKGSPLLLSEAVSRAETALKLLATPDPVGPGVLVGDAANPAYKNIVATLSGDVLNVELQCSPVIPCNYVLITMHIVPYTGTYTA